jgi:hypothetical protein
MIVGKEVKISVGNLIDKGGAGRLIAEIAQLIRDVKDLWLNKVKRLM